MTREDDAQLAYLDMLSARFCKIQDLINTKIFPAILQSAWDETPNHLDRLRRLSKLSFLDDTNWWVALRELRNNVTHEYPDDSDSVSDHANDLLKRTQELIAYWQKLKCKLHPLTKNHYENK